MLRLTLVVLLLLVTSASAAEVIVYEIYEISKIGSRLIAKGKREYSVSDVKVHPYERGAQKIAEKLIGLEQGYRVGARIFFEKELTGFGLLAKQSDYDFSWEWYNKEFGNRFRKLQGVRRRNQDHRASLHGGTGRSQVLDDTVRFKVGRDGYAWHHR